MSAQIVCQPLLGQTSIASGESIFITVLLLSNLTGIQWEAAVWHNGSESGDWDVHELQLFQDGVQDLGQSLPSNQIKILFQGSLKRPSSGKHVISFTVKYRIAGGEWKWANDQSSAGDAEIVFSRKGEIPASISHYLQHMDSRWFVTECIENSPVGCSQSETNGWSFSSPVPAATDQSSFSHIKLGLPTNILRWFCLARESRPWLCPRQGWRKLSLDEDAILISFLRDDGLHLVLLAVSLDDVLAVFKSDEEGNLVAVARNERSVTGTVKILAAVGRTFEEANEAVMLHARQVAGKDNRGMRREILSMTKIIPSESLDKWYDSFAYCTWNGLGQDLTEKKISDALDRMSNSGIDFSTIIIDDNWQSIDDFGPNNFHHRWIDFEANRKAFPRGLKQAISAIKEQNSSIKHVAVWHGILGYWNGIAPDGELARCYKTKTVKKQDNGFFGGGSLIAVDADDAHMLYDDFYKFLADCGVDSVKTDNQFLLDQLEDAEDRARFISTYQDAWIIAALRHFSARAISCMSQIPQILFYSQFLPSLPKLMVRNSEDFFPDEALSHPWHIFCNAHTNVFTRHLNVLPDWDMFQTSHEFSAFHAAARCISGGPIYFTDKPDEHDIGLIKQMTAHNMEETIILRPKVAKTTHVYANSKETRLLRISTSTIDTQTAMLGIFNINQHPVVEIVSLHDFPDLTSAKLHIIRAHVSKNITNALDFSGSDPVQLLSLDVKGYEILTAYPLHTMPHPTKKSSVNIAVLGLLDKMTGAASVLRSTFLETREGSLVQVVLKAMGQLGIYVSSDSAINISKAKMCAVLVPPEKVVYNPTHRYFEFDMVTTWETIKEKSHSKVITFEMLIV